MRNQRKLLLEQLDRKLKPFYGTQMVIIPDNGWINSIRTTINITLELLIKPAFDKSVIKRRKYLSEIFRCSTIYFAEYLRSGSLAIKLKMRKAYSDVLDNLIIYHLDVLFCKNTIFF